MTDEAKKIADGPPCKGTSIMSDASELLARLRELVDRANKPRPSAAAYDYDWQFDAATIAWTKWMLYAKQEISKEVPALLTLIESLQADLAEAKNEQELFDEDHADQNRMVDRIADLIGLPHDQELDATAFELWFSENRVRLESLQAENERLRRKMWVAVDMLYERKHGNPARSFSHNARIVLENALSRAALTAGDGK